MGKPYSGGVTIATGFKLNDPQPIVDYMVVDLISDLATLPNQFIGMETYVLQDSNKYIKKTSGWEVLSAIKRIIDAIPSPVVTGNVLSLVKSYPLGNFSGVKLLNLYFSFHKTVLANETINASFLLFDTVLNTETQIGQASSNTTSQHTVFDRMMSCEQSAGVIRTVKTNASIFSDRQILPDNIDNVTVNFSNPQVLRVYIRNSFTGAGMRQYLGVVELLQ